MITNINKWWHCFIAWEDNGVIHLSTIPWRVLLLGIFGDTNGFKWSWVPPWKVSIS